MKKLGLLFATVIMMLLFAVSASAETDGYYTYSVLDEKAIITDVDTSISGDTVIPDSIGGYVVTGIGEFAFSLCRNLTSIVIPNSVTSIGERAFVASGLTSITIPDSVTSIGEYAFFECESLESVTIPDSVTSIGGCAFCCCTSITSITIPGSVKSISDYLFLECYNLESITLLNGVKSIGREAFGCCYNLTSITIPDSLTDIENLAFTTSDKLENVYYAGSEEQWNEIKLGIDNENLTNATIHFNYCTANSDNKHKYESQITTPSTCLTTGIETLTCACSDTFSNEIPALGHKEIFTDYVEATCTETGLSVGKKCSACGEVFIPAQVIPAKGHSYTDWITTSEATCETNGKKIKLCSCGIFEEETIPSIGHSDTDNDGKCDNCNDLPKEETEAPAENDNVFSFLKSFLNNLLDFFRILFGIK